MIPHYRFQPGNSGRPAGSKNKLTKTIRETFFSVFTELQEDPKNNLLAFAKKYPKDFYAIAARLIPTEIHDQVTGIELKIVRVDRQMAVSSSAQIQNSIDGHPNCQD